MSITPRTAWLRAYAGRHVAALVILLLIAVSIFEGVRPVWIPNLRHTAGTGFTEFFSATANPINIAQGPDARMYYVGSDSVIVAVNLDGTGPTEYSPSLTNCVVHDLAPGPDGAIWYTEPVCNQIGRMTPAGIATEYPVPVTLHGSPWDIVQGTDLNMWFTLRNTCSTGSDCPASIGKISPADKSISIFTTPTRFGSPTEITKGPDGNIWFSEPGTSMLARALPDGTITEFPGTGGAPQIAGGADGNLWFSGGFGNVFGKMTVTGVVTTFSYPIGIGGSYLTQDLIGPAPDGKVWFSAVKQDNPTAPTVAVLGNIDPTGAVQDFALPAPPNSCCTRLPTGINLDTLNRVWYTDTNQTYIGHTDPIVVSIGPGGPTNPGETTGSGNPSEHSTQCHVALPVNCATGEFWHQGVDLTVPGRGLPISFLRTYSSSLSNVDGPLGFGWTHVYNMSITNGPTGGVDIHQENGSIVEFFLVGGSYKAPPRVLATLTKDSNGNYTFTRNDQKRFLFNGAGQLLSESDRNGNTTTFAYDASGRLTTVTDPARRSMNLAYDGNHLIQINDPAGRTVLYSYTSAGELSTVKDVVGGTTRFSYGSGHLMTLMTDPRGGTVANVYDSAGRVISQTDTVGAITTFTYLPTGTSIKDPNGFVTLETYVDGEVVSVTNAAGTPDASTSTLTYDQNTLGLATLTDPNGHVTKNTWDAQGNLLTTIDPLGRTVTATYNSFNDPLQVVDPSGGILTLTYDSHGNLIAAARTSGGAVLSSFTVGRDPAHPDDATSYTDPDGKKWTFTFDAAGDTLNRTDPLGNTTTGTYDVIGRMLSSVSALGESTRVEYNANADPTRIIDPLGHVSTISYDANHNSTGVTDADGNTTTQVFDAANRPVQTIKGDGTSTSVTYDGDGNPVKSVDGLGHATTYSYDALDRVVATTDPAGRTTKNTYDPAGNQLTLINPAGQATAYTYDAADQLTRIAYSDGKTPSVSITYDVNGNRATMTDGTGPSTYTYDGLGRMTKAVDGNGHAVSYAYDGRGNVTGLTYPDGTKVTRTFDAAGRMTSITDWLGHTTSFSYDGDGRLVTQAYPNHTQASYSFDAASHLTGIRDTLLGSDGSATAGSGCGSGSGSGSEATTGSGSGSASGSASAATGSGCGSGSGSGATTGSGSGSGSGSAVATSGSGSPSRSGSGSDSTASGSGSDSGSSAPFLRFDYARNGVGFVAGVSSTGVPQASPRLLTYDKANRLTRNQATATSVYSYDAAGQLVNAIIRNSTQISMTYDVSGQLTGFTRSQGGTATQSSQFTYDPNGNRTQQVSSPGPNRTYTYDQQNRLTQYTGPVPGLTVEAGDPARQGSFNITVNYTYDGDGLRMAKKLGPFTETFSYDIVEGAPVIIQDGPVKYVTGQGGLPLEQVLPDGTVHYYHQDQLGSTAALTDAQGRVSINYSYDDYGMLAASRPTIVNTFLFGGQYLDPESGLYQMRARYYDPSTAQFLTVDPLAPVTGARYSYAAGNPANFVDPTGLTCSGWPWTWGDCMHSAITAITSGDAMKALSCAAANAASLVGTAIDAAGGCIEGIVKNKSIGGTLMHAIPKQVRSAAATMMNKSRWLLQKNPWLLKFSKFAGWASFLVSIAAGLLAGESLGRSAFEGAISGLLSIMGGFIGTFVCGIETVATALAGAPVCPILVGAFSVVFGYLGQLGATALADKMGLK